MVSLTEEVSPEATVIGWHCNDLSKLPVKAYNCMGFKQDPNINLVYRSSTEQSSPAPHDGGRDLLRCISIDLEVGRRDRRIRALAGVRPDTGESVIHPSADSGLAAALDRLDRLAEGADFLLGHNLIAFDLPLLKAASSGLRLLRLPAVDTLRLNPLAFPRNPLSPPGQALPGRATQARAHQRPGAGCQTHAGGL